MENDTIKKIDEAIDKIQSDGNNFVNKSVDIIHENTDTKLFNIDNVSNNRELEKTKEFDRVVNEEHETIDNKDDDGDLSIYIFYFTSLIIVVVLVITFIMFFYK